MGEAADEMNERPLDTDEVWGPDPAPFAARSESERRPLQRQDDLTAAGETGREYVQPTAEDQADPETLRVEIEQTRAEMSGTIDAIQERLQPSTLIEQAKETAREAASTAVEDAKEAVREATI